MAGEVDLINRRLDCEMLMRQNSRLASDGEAIRRALGQAEALRDQSKVKLEALQGRVGALQVELLAAKARLPPPGGSLAVPGRAEELAEVADY